MIVFSNNHKYGYINSISKILLCFFMTCWNQMEGKKKKKKNTYHNFRLLLFLDDFDLLENNYH